MSLKKTLSSIVAGAFEAAGYDGKYGDVVVSQRRDLADYQCNGALPAAKPYKKNPRQIAEEVVDNLSGHEAFTDVSLAGPGFINLRLSDEFLASFVSKMAEDGSGRMGVDLVETPQMVLVDYGGPNVAKPLHIGHLRAPVIGESIKRLSRFLGHDTLGDIHMGDWGLQMGQIITELKYRDPDMVYFDPHFEGEYPAESPVTIEDLEEIYPIASGKCKADPEWMAAAQEATADLQNGRPGYIALWRHFVDVSKVDLKKNYDKLEVEFDLWLGESDVQDLIPKMVEQLVDEGHAVRSDGALVVPVAQEDDKKEIAPLMLVKSNESVGYGTTDLATILMRVRDQNPDAILYVVDGRQQYHFRQVFRAAYKSGIADQEKVSLEHNYFGTVNGKDGKPFKTREGGVMRLEDLIEMVVEKAYERMAEIDAAADYPPEERAEIARQVGIAALKFADLVNHRTGDYVFDLDRFSSFEGRTGPYLLYAVVRTRSILRKAAEQGLTAGKILPAASEAEREVYMKLLELPETLEYAFETRAPNHLCDFAYNLATLFNRFYREHHILTESDKARQASWLGLSRLTADVLTLTLDLLGISVPERM
ncbi:MAG: arginine--tRNA ligase [Ardenticatenaceae bacterium]|nr:arginine--tRNA ligase [Ardenticatenaceae bacterium]